MRARRRVHAGRVGAFLRADVESKGRGGSLAPGLSYGLGEHVEVSASALLGPTYGFYAGAALSMPGGPLRLLVAAGVPVYVHDGLRPGVHGALGLSWDAGGRLGLFVLVGVEHFPTAEEGYEKTLLVPSAGVQVRL